MHPVHPSGGWPTEPRGANFRTARPCCPLIDGRSVGLFRTRAPQAFAGAIACRRHARARRALRSKGQIPTGSCYAPGQALRDRPKIMASTSACGAVSGRIFRSVSSPACRTLRPDPSAVGPVGQESLRNSCAIRLSWCKNAVRSDSPDTRGSPVVCRSPRSCHKALGRSSPPACRPPAKAMRSMIRQRWPQ